MDWVTLEQILQATRQADLSEFRVLAALALMRMGSWEGAIGEYRETLRLNPGNEGAKSTSAPTCTKRATRFRVGRRQSAPAQV
jgi:hypothetical protein